MPIMGPLWFTLFHITHPYLPTTQTISVPQHHRMVGWLKGFVHSRQHGSASLMKGYTIHMLVRKAPTQIAYEYNRRFAEHGADMTGRGHLILVQDLVAHHANRPGCGVVHVKQTTSNFTLQRYTRLPPAFLLRFNAYNALAKKSARYANPEAPDTKVRFYKVSDGNPLFAISRSYTSTITIP
jgi:hypothetical protein